MSSAAPNDENTVSRMRVPRVRFSIIVEFLRTRFYSSWNDTWLTCSNDLFFSTVPLCKIPDALIMRDGGKRQGDSQVSSHEQARNGFELQGEFSPGRNMFPLTSLLLPCTVRYEDEGLHDRNVGPRRRTEFSEAIHVRFRLRSGFQNGKYLQRHMLPFGRGKCLGEISVRKKLRGFYYISYDVLFKYVH